MDLASSGRELEDLLRQLLTAAFSSRSRALSALICRFSSQRSESNALFLHSPCHHTFVDGGLLDQTSLGMTAVVDTGIVSVSFQIAVGYVCPCLAPYDKLFLAVPTFGDGILSAELWCFWGACWLAPSLASLLRREAYTLSCAQPYTDTASPIRPLALP